MKEHIRIEMNINDDEVDDVIRLAQRRMKRVKRLSFILYMNIIIVLVAGFKNWFSGIYWISIIDALMGLFSLWMLGKNKTEIKKCWIIEQSLKRYKEDKAELLK